jgi:hypothetical protein
MVKRSIEDYQKVADDPNHIACACACYEVGIILVTLGGYSDVKKGVKYLNTASKKGENKADIWLHQIHNATKEGKLASRQGLHDLMQIIRSAAMPLKKVAFSDTVRTAHIQTMRAQSNFSLTAEARIHRGTVTVEPLKAVEQRYTSDSHFSWIFEKIPQILFPHEASVSAGMPSRGARPLFKCWGCDSEAAMVCSRCRTARFCSAECQRKAWKQHKEECNRLSSAAPEEDI